MIEDPQDEYSLIPDLIPKSYATILEDELEKRLPWYYTPSASGDVKVDENDKLIVDTPQLHHIFLDSDGTTSPHFTLIQPMVWFLERYMKFEIKSLFRIKANLLLAGNSTLDNYNIPHIDHPRDDHISMVYYVNNSDGDTRIFDKTITDGEPIGLNCIGQFEPSKGRSLVFKSNRFHCSAPPVKHKNRMVLNFVMQIAT
jgi:hypothetical protein